MTFGFSSSSIEYKVMDHNGSEVGVFSQVAGGNEVRRNSEELIQRIIDEVSMTTQPHDYTNNKQRIMR